MAIDDFYMIAAIATIAEKVTNLRSTDLFLTTLQSWDETKKKRWDEREWFCEFVIKKIETKIFRLTSVSLFCL